MLTSFTLLSIAGISSRLALSWLLRTKFSLHLSNRGWEDGNHTETPAKLKPNSSVTSPALMRMRAFQSARTSMNLPAGVRITIETAKSTQPARRMILQASGKTKWTPLGALSVFAQSPERGPIFSRRMRQGGRCLSTHSMQHGQ